MAESSISGVVIRGIASAVPRETQGLEELASLQISSAPEKIVEVTGVRTRHIARPGQTTSDLCFAAAESLLKNLAWDRASVDALIFVSQTFDYVAPPTSCCLQARLGLPKSCAAFDIALGCSGYVYGLWVASSLVLAGCRRVLLLAGETTSRIISPLDKTAVPLFGDAGTATALEREEGHVIHFAMDTDGSGFGDLIIPAGGHRMPRTSQTSIRTPREGGNIRSDEDLYMKGPEVLAFALREVPPLLARILARAGWTKEQVDYFVMHQANKWMLDQLARRLRIPAANFPLALEDFGNTVSASVPLAITHCLRSALAQKSGRVVMAGFGVGLSWGAVAVEMGPLLLPELEIVP
jgi:3-oxoacyl-[acyl-carrier-protein] synthase III